MLQYQRRTSVLSVDLKKADFVARRKTSKGEMNMAESNTDPSKKTNIDPNVEPNTDPSGESKTGKTFTREELATIVAKQKEEIQANTKTQIQEILAKQKKELEKARDEGRKEAKMTAEQLEAKHRQEQQQQMDQEREEFKRERLQFKAERLLVEKGLSVDFGKFVIGSDEEQTTANISQLEKTFQTAVSKAVKDKLAGRNLPSTGNGAGDVTDSDISKLNINELMQKVQSGEITHDQAMAAFSKTK